MSLVYFDSSAFVKLLVDERGSDDAARVWQAADLALSSPVAYPEVRAALAAAGRDRRLSRADLELAESIWERYWSAVSQVALTPALALHAGRLTSEHVLRGADAVHLASAIAVDGGDFVFAGWDKQLRTAAHALGMILAPSG